MENNFYQNGENQYNGYSSFNSPGVSATPTSFVTYIPYGYTPKTYEEKKGIRRVALVIGISLLLVTAITFFWATALYFIAGIFGITPNEVQNAVSDPAVMQVLQVLLSSIMFSVPFIIVFKLGNYRISDIIPLEKPKKGNRLALYFMGTSICAFANIASSYAGYFFRSFGIEYNVDYGENPTGIFGFLLSLLATAVVPGLIEEFACRGMIMGSLRKYGDGFAILVTAILFGLMHGNFDQIPFAFTVGIGLGFIAVKSNSLWIAVAVHFTNNFISVLFNYALDGISDNTQNLIYTVYLMVALLLGIVAVAISKDKEIFKLEKSDTASSFGTKMKWFFTSPVIVIFAVVCILESMLYFFV